jgi:hypothetical protein
MSFPGLWMTSVRFRLSEMDIDYKENLYDVIIPFTSHAFFTDDEFGEGIEPTHMVQVFAL